MKNDDAIAIELSIIIPAYNEEARIGKSLHTIIDYLAPKNINYEIVVVDDGSSDSTYEEAQSISKEIKVHKLSQNSGKGAAVRKGMLIASGEIKLFSDADLSTPIYEAEKIIKALKNGADIAIGSRAVDYSTIKKHQPFYREFMGKTFNKIVQAMVIKGIHDTQCGFKGFKKSVADKIFNLTLIDGFSFDVEVLYLANIFDYKVEEISVEWYNDERSKVNPIVDSTKMLFEIMKIKKLHKTINKK